MCGVFMGSSCAPRDRLNWTIHIPDKKDKNKKTDDRPDGVPIIPVKDLLSLHDFHDPQQPDHGFHFPDVEQTASPSLHPPPLGNQLDNEMTGDQEDRRKKRVKKAAVNPSAATFKVLQLTDLHFDPYFVPGSRTDCGEPVCCRSIHGPAQSLATMAGIWGEYTDCDTPFFTIENALQRVSQEHPDVSYWLMTGDLPPHDIWEYSRNETIAHIKFSSWLIDHYSKDIGVFPVIGNHEAVPINR